MKKLYIIAFLIAGVLIKNYSQTTRYFEFKTQCGHGNWQDTSFIAATSVQEVIDSVLTDLSRPYEQRKFISGPIAPGHGGHNHNANHWFKWHFIPDQWVLVEMAIEICDGCPYSDLDSDTSYWIRTIGRFCPWSGKPVREIAPPSESILPTNKSKISFFPNPAQNYVIVNKKIAGMLSLNIYNLQGKLILNRNIEDTFTQLDIKTLPDGIYWIKARYGHNVELKKMLKISSPLPNY
ncbi:MAG: T9SS type A sorting domain-containing protein [Bacteroidales bacterium]|nr:T9SS type A sorting domain-containing protein [Bacteroidales bacterium]